MDNSVPYIVYEGEQVRHERTQKRLVLALCVSLMVNGIIFILSRH